MEVQVDVYWAWGEKETLGLPREDLLSRLQEIVEGYVELVRNVNVGGLEEGKILLVNEDGRLKRLPPTQSIRGILGNAVIMNDADFD